MKNTLIIGFFKEEELKKGFAGWYGKYLKEINDLSPVSEIKKENTPEAIGYLIGKDNNDEKCFDINVLDYFSNEKTFKLNYIVSGTKEFNSAFIKKAVRDLIPAGKLKGPFLPVCISVEKEKLDKIIDDETALFKVKELLKENDWNSIYKMFFPISELRNRKYLWDNDALLSIVSFATAKLSETYVNLKLSFHSEEERKKFLLGQRKYREETILLRKRCIEINPNKAAYYSNLGYSYYQFTRELAFPGGRRDGNILEDALKSIDFIDKALELDPQRVSDLYRKGQLLTNILPPLILFGGKREPSEDAIKEWKQKIKTGIDCFKKVEQVWQILPVLEDKMTKRYHKEYVKSMYNMSRSYSELAGDAWDCSDNLLGLNVFEYETLTVIEKEKLKNTDSAIYYMEKCITDDNIMLNKSFPLPSIIILAKYSGVCEGVYKLYSLGKYYFQKHSIISKCGKGERQEADYFLGEAEEYLKAALKFPWKQSNIKQSKAFIAEKLSKVYIAKRDYQKAVNILSGFMEGRVDYYIRYTYATACILSCKTTMAESEIREALKNEKSNFEIWLGYFILFVKNLKENKYDDAEENLRKADEISKRSGKKNTDKILTGHAFIAYRRGNKEEAVKLLKKAQQINPFNKGIKKKLRNWEKNE